MDRRPDAVIWPHGYCGTELRKALLKVNATFGPVLGSARVLGHRQDRYNFGYRDEEWPQTLLGRKGTPLEGVSRYDWFRAENVGGQWVLRNPVPLDEYPGGHVMFGFLTDAARTAEAKA